MPPPRARPAWRCRPPRRRRRPPPARRLPPRYFGAPTTHCYDADAAGGQGTCLRSLSALAPDPATWPDHLQWSGTGERLPPERIFPDPCAYLRHLLLAARRTALGRAGVCRYHRGTARREFPCGNLFTPPGPLKVIRKTHHRKRTQKCPFPAHGHEEMKSADSRSSAARAPECLVGRRRTTASAARGPRMPPARAAPSRARPTAAPPEPTTSPPQPAAPTTSCRGGPPS